MWMKILYISYDGMTDPLGQSQVIPYLIGLTENHQITIISCEKEDRYKEQKETIQELLTLHHIEWIPVSYSKLPSVFSKQWNIARIKRKAISFLKAHHPDVVHCRSYMAALIGLYLKKRFKIKFIFDMRGFWADERIDGKIWSMNNLIHRRLYHYFKKKEIDFLSHADYTISLTESAKREILSWKQFNKKALSIKVIPCCADLSHFSLATIQRSEQEMIKKKLNITEQDFVVTYLGSIGTWYMLDEMLDFFSCVCEKYSNAKFLFITPDPSTEILEKARLKGIDSNKLIVTSASRKEVPLYLSVATLAVYFIKPTYSKIASSPTKTAEILGLGIPIITNSGVGDNGPLLENSGAGLLVSDFNTEIYKKVISQFSLLLSTDKEKMIELARTGFSLNKGVELYQTVYEAISKK